MITFTVRGLPAPQGSKRIVPSGRGGRRFHVVEGNHDRVKGWRSDVRDAAYAAIRRDLPDETLVDDVFPALTGPVAVELAFRLPRPKGHHGARGLRPSAPVWPATKPDLDKLARAVLDACTGLVWTDDSQVVDLGLRKRYADAGTPGVTVTVRDLTSRADLVAPVATPPPAADAFRAMREVVAADQLLLMQEED